MSDPAFRAAQLLYDNLLPEPEPPEWDFPEETNGRLLRLKRKQARVSLVAMARELDIYPSYLHDLEAGHTAWPEDVEARYETALITLSTSQSL